MAKVRYRLIPGLPGYRVGDDGSVWSRMKQSSHGRGTGTYWFVGRTWRRLKVRQDAGGSSVVTLGRNRIRRVGRLVLHAFVGPCPRGMECCHFPDRTPSNCRLENLRWDTSSANNEDQRRHGTLVGGERHGMAKLSNTEIKSIRSLAGTMTQREIGRKFGVSQGHVSDIINQRKRTASSHAGKGLQKR